MKKRIARVFFGILAPPFMGMIFIYGVESIPFVVVSTYYVIGVQAFLYAVIMEFLVREYFPPVTTSGIILFIIISTTLGTVAGYSVYWTLPLASLVEGSLVLVGSLVGAICGVCLMLIRW